MFMWTDPANDIFPYICYRKCCQHLDTAYHETKTVIAKCWKYLHHKGESDEHFWFDKLVFMFYKICCLVTFLKKNDDFEIVICQWLFAVKK